MWVLSTYFHKVLNWKRVNMLAIATHQPNFKHACFAIYFIANSFFIVFCTGKGYMKSGFKSSMHFEYGNC
jgi:hypothetical protein